MPPWHAVREDLSLLHSSTTSSELQYTGASEHSSLLHRIFSPDADDAESIPTDEQEAKAIQAIPQIDLSLRLSTQPQCWMNVFVPLSPTSERTASSSDPRDDAEDKAWSVEVSAPNSDRHRLQELQDGVRQRHKEVVDEIESQGGLGVGIWTLWMDAKDLATNTLAADGHQTEPQATAASGEATATATAGDSGDGDAQQDGQNGIEMKRSIFWSHHLIAPSKRKDFTSLCSELDVWGLVKIGYPGYLIFEGPIEGVEEMERRVKGMQWHALTLRSTHTFLFPSPSPSLPGASDGTRGEVRREAIRTSPLSRGHAANHNAGKDAQEKVRTGYEEVESVGEIVQRLRCIDMDEAEIVQSLGIRTAKGSGLA
ncbi:uncharacterized protein PFL1_06367 [Pseudozyma flocculosa PF-1]|uniref:Uncharacterized protein n=1 Tax=Pseudozyma flocculosa PF-1 TaxID=1277687 RepID=A0A061H1Y4_9BASI|nr:uncharacterized protein PFL1_06367 [Pseudozyma flocculosa PF-1]EPQ26159.1 hypothetical protein PFL1_06367 [Pseudozyma flocculosa PF-1]